MNSTAMQIRYESAKRFALEAGRLTLEHFRGEFVIERKADDSPVTIADRAAEQLLRRRISEEFPEDGVIGEEFANKEGTSGFDWALDPIDGTKSFIHGVPLYGTMVGLLFDNRPVAGVIEYPPLDERIAGGVGLGSWHQRGARRWTRAKVSATTALDKSLFTTSEISGFRERGSMDAFLQLEQQARLTRTWGDCFGYLLVATGRAEVMIDAALNIWDAAAVSPILVEAGGVFTDWLGRANVHAGEGVGSNGSIHSKVLEILGPASGS